MMTERTMDMDISTDATSDHVKYPRVLFPENGQRNSKGQEDPKKSLEKHRNIRTVQYYKLFSFADRVDYLLILVGTIAAAGNGLSMPMMTVIFGHLVDAFGGTMNTKQVVHEVSKVSLDFVYLALSSFAASFLQVACWVITGERQAARIRRLHLKTILRQDMSYFDTQANTGEIVGQMSGGTVLIQDAIGEKVGKFIQFLLSFIGALIIAFIKGWLLTLVMLSCVPLLVFSGALMGYVIAKVATRGQDAYSAAANVVEQTIGSIRTVVSFAGEKQAISRYNQSLTKAYKATVQEGFASGLGLGTVMLIVCSSYSLAVWYGGKMIVNKGYTAGDVITISFAILTGSMSLGQASPCFSAFAAGQAAACKMFEAIRRKSLIDVYDTEGCTLDDIHGVIELRDVYFSYPSRPHEQILSGISLSIPSGTTAALVGQSGSGKSTVISLIERFYDPQSGQVLIDGVNLKEFQLKWIRQKIGLVSQEPVLFTSTIKDNIAYGKDCATDEEIQIASELANAAKFIDKLPKGLDTMVGESGTQLSGGQKQRIALARAILRDPRIFLLDEATSALDAESERIVQESLDRIMINRTTVIIAHRLRTIRNADMIAVIDQGKIVEKGSHQELTKNSDGTYFQLMKLQEISLTAKYDEKNDLERQEIARDSGLESIHHFSVSKSSSRESSGIGNNTHHSFSATNAVPNQVNALEEAIAGASGPPSQSLPEVPLCRLVSLNKPEIPILLMGTLAAGASGAVKPIFGLLLAKMITIFYEPADELLEGSRFWALIFLSLGVASLILSPTRAYLFAVAGGKLIRRIRRICFVKLIYMEVSWFDEPNHSSGALGARLSTDAASLRALVGDALGLLVQNITTAIAGIFIAFTANWQLALIVLFLLPLIAVNGYVQYEFLKGFSADSKKSYEEASQAANDAVRSIRTVASFCTEEKVLNLYRKKCEGPIKAAIKQGLISGVGFGLSNLFQFAVYSCSFYAGARLVEKGKTTITDVFQVYFALTLAAVGISQSSSLANDVTKTKNSAASIFSILERKSKINSSDESGMTPENIKGEVEFSHVTFKYPTRPDVQVFRDLCLDIPFGKTVALVGESGSGKSTVISLLQRFYDPDLGVITLDGMDIQKLQLKWLRQQMGLVSQEPMLFNDTIRANIAYGKEGNATEDEISEAAQLANAHKFISSLHKGYDTVVGERGLQLSGGQKQRVAIARAIVKNPKILLLDEATSALDSESEKAVQDALDKAMVNRTTIVVAHRLATIKGADIIALISNGAVAEKGKHESLMNIKGGIYASLVELHK